MPEDEGVALYVAALSAAQSAAGPFLEVGTYCGKSAIYVGVAAMESANVLFTVDHHRGSEENQPGWEHHDRSVVDPRTGRMDTLPYARRAIEEAGLESYVILVVGRSETVAREWDRPLSFLFIDGGHGEQAAWLDYRSWAPKVAVGGLMAIHDVFPDPTAGGRPPFEIYTAALESEEWIEVEALSCGSLRVLRRLPSKATSS